MDTQTPVPSAPDKAPDQPPPFSFWHFLFRCIFLTFKFVQAVVSVTSVVSVALFVLLLGFLIFTKSDQFTDLLVAMIYDWRSFLFADGTMVIVLRDGPFVGALIVWAFTLAFSARWVLLRADLKPVMLRTEFKAYQPTFDSIQLFLLKYVPRSLALIPFLIVGLSFIRISITANVPYAKLCQAIWCLGIITTGALVLAVLSYIHQQLSTEKDNRGLRQSTSYGEAIKGSEPHDPAEFPLFQRWIWILVILNGILTLLFMGSSSFATIVGFGSIFIFALAAWGQAGLWLHYQSARRSFSFLGLLIVGGIIISLLRVNIMRRAVRLTSTISAQTADNRMTDASYVSGWLAHRIASAPADTTALPVIIIAAEGGGSRSAHWTAGVMAHLDSVIPNFRQHILAISGVSGGSVGSGIYVAWHHDHANQPASQNRLDAITSGDFLSGLVGAFCYPDPAAALLWPFSARFDRARWLEDRFSEQYYAVSNTNTLDSGMVSLFNQHRNTYDLPLLLLNSTVVETGKKAILSPVKLSDSTFYEAQDVLHDVSGDIPLKTAMGLSARFPLVTPAGTVYGERTATSYRLVDGGYFENTGLHTAYQLLQLVNKRITTLTKSQNPQGRKIIPVVLFIKNGDGRDPGIIKASSGFAPLSAFYKAWDHRTPTTVGDMNYFIANSKQQEKFIQFVLPRSNSIVFPLGWYLSQTAQDSIDTEVNRMAAYAKTGPQWLNFQAYHTLADSLKLSAAPKSVLRHPDVAAK